MHVHSAVNMFIGSIHGLLDWKTSETLMGEDAKTSLKTTQGLKGEMETMDVDETEHKTLNQTLAVGTNRKLWTLENISALQHFQFDIESEFDDSELNAFSAL